MVGPVYPWYPVPKVATVAYWRAFETPLKQLRIEAFKLNPLQENCFGYPKTL